jgi:hypothetical protein
MPTRLPENQIYRGFDLINIQEFNSKNLLESQIPDVILLAILGNYPKEQTEAVLRLLVGQLRLVCANPPELSKYLKQLILLSRLRKIEDLTTKIAEEMPITYDIETDALYKRGKAKERLEKEREFTKSLIENTDFLDERIALLVGVEVIFVKNVRAELKRLKI